MHIAQPFIM